MWNKYVFYLSILLLPTVNTWGQTPNDGLMMPNGQLCVLGQYSSSTWENYWEGTQKRSNANLGTVQTQSVMLMANYGITSKLRAVNVMVGLPFVSTKPAIPIWQGKRVFRTSPFFLNTRHWKNQWLRAC